MTKDLLVGVEVTALPKGKDGADDGVTSKENFFFPWGLEGEGVSRLGSKV